MGNKYMVSENESRQNHSSEGSYLNNGAELRKDE